MRARWLRGPRAPRTPAELARTAGRVLLWCVLALLLVRGAGDVLASDEKRSVVRRERSSLVGWPDDAARAFAVEFAHAYLSVSPEHPERYARGVTRFVAPPLAASIVPRLPRHGSPQLVETAVVAGVERVDGRRAMVTVAASVLSAGRVVWRHLTVPVARDELGGLVVYDLPSLAPAPRMAVAPRVEGEPLTGAERGELEDVLARFFSAYLGGRDGELTYFAAPGRRLSALRAPLELAGVDSVWQLPAGGRAVRRVLVAVRARDPRSRVVLALRYRVVLVRGGGRWQVSDVNSIPEVGR